MRFFIYADNLNPTQLKRRAPEHQFLFKAYIPDHTIKFGRWSNQWRCGLATIVPSAGERVWGAVFELTPEDVEELDKFERKVYKAMRGCDLESKNPGYEPPAEERSRVERPNGVWMLEKNAGEGSRIRILGLNAIVCCLDPGKP